MARKKTGKAPTDVNERGEVLYVCTTPFQIMTSISMVKASGESADLFVDPQFSDAEEILARIRKERVFRQVINAEDSMLKKMRTRKGLLKYICFAFRLINGKRLYCDMLHGEFEYKSLYASSNNAVTRYLMNYILKRKMETRFILFDDGGSSYDNDAVAGFYRSKTARLNRLIVKEIKAQPYTRYLYMPELFQKMHPDNLGEVIRIKNWAQNNELCEMLLRIFNAQLVSVQEKAVFLDTLCEEVFDEQTAKRYEHAIELIIDAIGASNIGIKRHPRDKKKNKYCISEIARNGVPFECLIPKMGNDKVLITYSSTAAILPKILFDKELYIIFLFKMFDSVSSNSLQTEIFLDYFSQYYSNQDRIMFPKDEQELLYCINRVTKLINDN